MNRSTIQFRSLSRNDGDGSGNVDCDGDSDVNSDVDGEVEVDGEVAVDGDGRSSKLRRPRRRLRRRRHGAEIGRSVSVDSFSILFSLSLGISPITELPL